MPLLVGACVVFLLLWKEKLARSSISLSVVVFLSFAFSASRGHYSLRQTGRARNERRLSNRAFQGSRIVGGYYPAPIGTGAPGSDEQRKDRTAQEIPFEGHAAAPNPTQRSRGTLLGNEEGASGPDYSSVRNGGAIRYLSCLYVIACTNLLPVDGMFWVVLCSLI